MSFENFKKHLDNSLSDISNLSTDWRYNNLSKPNTPVTLKWASTDSEDLFKSALKDGFSIDKSFKSRGISESLFNSSLSYYLDNPITYRLNSYGFRSDEFSLKESGNVFLGCSDTFGVGHKLEHSWPYLLTKLKFPNETIYNLGAPGSGSDTHFRLINSLKYKLKIKNIFHWLPIRTRFEIFNDKKLNNIKNGISKQRSGFSTISPVWEIDNGIFSTEYVKHSLLSDTVRDMNNLKNILAIKSISDELGVPYYLANFEEYISSYERVDYQKIFEYLKINSIPYTLLARDFQHMSISDSAKVVAHFINEIDNNINSDISVNIVKNII